MFDLSSLRTGPMRLIHAKHGDFLVLAGDSNGIGALLAYYGEFCEREVTLMCALTRPGDTVVDVGANIGTHSVPLARHLTPQGKLIAFEAQPVIAMLLEANLAMNGIGWVDVRLAAAGRELGSICVPAVDYLNVGNVGAVSLVGAQSDGLVPMQTVDQLAINPALIKIDVEGMELEVLRGATTTIASCRPVLYLENNPIPAAESVDVLRWLQEAGYRLYWDVCSLHESSNFRGQAQPYFSDGFSSNVLALPDDRAVDFAAFGLEAINDVHDHKMTRLLADMGL